MIVSKNLRVIEMKKILIVATLLLISLSIAFAGPSFPDKETDSVLPIGMNCCIEKTTM